jgi:hypothetical protein
MSQNILQKCLNELGLTENETADLFGVHPRTVSRWSKADSMPEQVKASFITWIRLKRLHLCWRPNAVALGQDNLSELAELISQHRIHTLEIYEVIERVKARGGPATPWKVDLKKGEASLGFMSIRFGLLPDGGFVPVDYSRSDELEPDPARDQNLLHDGFYCIDQALQNVTVQNGAVQNAAKK